MAPFHCNICGAYNVLEHFETEPASCRCGSNVRSRALVHMLSLELFGRSLILPDFPMLKALRGLGMTDKECYAKVLAEKFDYTNTYYDRDPRLDFTSAHPELYGTYDFIVSSDVLEHVAPPVTRVFQEVHSLLKPNGFLTATVPCRPDNRMQEHFPELHEYRVVRLGNSHVLVNRRRDGAVEVRDDLVFHEGIGSTLEMRQFGVAPLEETILRSGFREVQFLTEDTPSIGVIFDDDVSQPLIARKSPFWLASCARNQLVDLWNAAEDRAYRESRRAEVAEGRLHNAEDQIQSLSSKIRMANRSRWLRLGRKFGLGPEFNL